MAFQNSFVGQASKNVCLPRPGVSTAPRWQASCGGGDCFPDFGTMDALRMQVGGAGCEHVLGWPVTLKALDLSPTWTLRFPGPARGSWVPLPPPLVFWWVCPTHVCHRGLHPHGSHHQHCSWAPASAGSQGLALPSPVGGSSQAALPSTWSLPSWAQHLISITVDLAITHPSSASPPSSSLRAHLASRALYMVGFHSFVCTFGEGLLCARPCARHRVNGRCP